MADDRPTYKTLLTATDFSEQSMPGLEHAAALAAELDAEVVVLYVVEDHLPPILGTGSLQERDEILEDQRVRAKAKLDELLVERFSHCRGCRAEAVKGVAAREIVEKAVEHGADLVVLASHGYGPLRQMLIGSTAERVVHHAPCPVLVVPSKKPD